MKKKKDKKKKVPLASSTKPQRFGGDSMGFHGILRRGVAKMT
jgi:hypothetical protein